MSITLCLQNNGHKWKKIIHTSNVFLDQWSPKGGASSPVNVTMISWDAEKKTLVLNYISCYFISLCINTDVIYKYL